MALLTAFVSYLVKFIVMIAVVTVGFLCGKKLRDNKKAN